MNFRVAAGADATGTQHHGPRAGTHLDFKILTKDTHAGIFLMAHRNVPQGGPVRHLHYAQEQWVYFIEGNKVVIEVGDERFTVAWRFHTRATKCAPSVGLCR